MTEKVAGHRRLLVSGQLLDQVLRHGTRCAFTSDVPRDIRVVGVEKIADEFYQFHVTSGSYGDLEPGQPCTIVPTFSRVYCGRDRMEAIDKMVRRLRDRYVALIGQWDVGLPQDAYPTAEEVRDELEEILKLTSGPVSEGPAGAPCPRI